MYACRPPFFHVNDRLDSLEEVVGSRASQEQLTAHLQNHSEKTRFGRWIIGSVVVAGILAASSFLLTMWKHLEAITG